MESCWCYEFEFRKNTILKSLHNTSQINLWILHNNGSIASQQTIPSPAVIVLKCIIEVIHLYSISALMTLAAWNDLNYEMIEFTMPTVSTLKHIMLNDISLVCCLHCCWCLYGLSLKRHARGTLAKHRFKVAFWFVELYRITFSLTTEECCKCNEGIWVIIMTICSWFVLFFSGSFQTYIFWQLRLGAPVLTGSALDKRKFLMPALPFTSAFRLTYNVPFPWPIHLQFRLLLFGLLELGLLPHSALKTRI